MRFTKKDDGFSLVEILVVMAILAIIASLAYPAYRTNAERTRRGDVRAIILENAQFMERFYTENNGYDQTNAAAPVAVALPITTSPRTGVPTLYTVQFRPGTLNANAYTIEAIPVAGGSMAADTCGTYSVTNTGARAVTGTETVTNCWER